MRERTASVLLIACSLLFIAGIGHANFSARAAVTHPGSAEPSVRVVKAHQVQGVDKGERMRTERFRVSPDGTLEVKVPGADVNIRTGNVREATVDIYAYHRSSSKRARDYYNRFDWDVSERNNVVRVEAKRPRTGSWNNNGVRMTIDVTIPERFRTEVATSGGDITAQSLNGRTALRTSGGDIEVRRIQGDEILLTTSGGDIMANDLSGPVEIHTSGGDIEVGNVNGPRIEIGTSGGDIIARRLQARSIEVGTSGGDIELEHLIGAAEVVTSGGDIQVGRVEGGLTATTSGGDIEIVLSKAGAVSLSTTGGDVFVLAPTSLSADLDLRGQSVRVDGSFDFQGDQTRRRINGRIGGGGPLLKATTTSGSVVLRSR